MSDFSKYLSPLCTACGAPLSKPFVCSGCQQAAYCNAQCQKKDWKEHKQVCKTTTADRLHRALELAGRGDIDAQYEAGMCYRRLKDLPNAAKWLRLAAGAGHPQAQFCIGEIMTAGTAADAVEAVRWFRLAAAGQCIPAKFHLGRCLFEAWGCARDEREGLRWILEAAEKGHTEAQLSAGQCLMDGLGAEKDPVAAVRWFQAASDGGDIDALAFLAHCESFREPPCPAPPPPPHGPCPFNRLQERHGCAHGRRGGGPPDTPCSRGRQRLGAVQLCAGETGGVDIAVRKRVLDPVRVRGVPPPPCAVPAGRRGG